MSEIEDKILELRNSLKSDRLDMSFGEIMNLYEDGELIISPEYQRAFRWNDKQRSDFIESILLGIPIPPIFVAEDENGRWELVDGLQRISTILSFFELLQGIDNIQKENYKKLVSTELAKDVLNNITVNDLPIKMKITLKRAVCRVEILRWDSNFNMKYHLFKRLNTSSSPLSVQEVRNCIFLGSFNNLIKELSKNCIFQNIIHINKRLKEEMYLEELVLRFFSFKYQYKNFEVKHSIEEFLDNFMQDIHQDKIKLDLDKEKNDFLKILDFFDKNNFGDSIFKGRNYQFNANLYDSIMFVTFKFYDIYLHNPNLFLKKIEIMKNDEQYKEVSGHKTHLVKRMKKKIERAIEIFDV
jgi:hypothetical protein